MKVIIPFPKALLASLFVLLAVQAPLMMSQQGTPDVETMIKRLGPGPFLGGARSLDHLIAMSDAAVIAQVKEKAHLTFVEVPSSNGYGTNVMASSIYVVNVQEILYSKTKISAVLPGPGSTVQVQIRVGRDEALAVNSGADIVRPGDTCLLFLFRTPQEKWDLEGWHLQFRRREMAAEEVAIGQIIAGSEGTSQAWLGPEVQTRSSSSGTFPAWSSLVAEVRRRGGGTPR